MSRIISATLKSRTTRHILFWITWVLSFTFIKSFGAEMEVYLGWFLYYIMTLPIFLLHTYLIVYWIGKKFIHGWSILIFILLFLILLLSFSYLELLLSHKVLSIFFPEIFIATGNYLGMANIVISGIGNLYIVLVFIAVKMIRKWYLTTEEKKKINERFLEDKVAKANARIQPGMLLYAIGRMEEMAENKSEDVSAAIAILSEVLNGTMLAGENRDQRIDEELSLLKKLFELYSIFNHIQVPVITINGADLKKSTLPALAIFTVTEIVMRSIQVIFQYSLELLNSGLLLEARIRLDFETKHFTKPDLAVVQDELNQLYPGRFEIKGNTDKFYYTLNIREKALRG